MLACVLGSKTSAALFVPTPLQTQSMAHSSQNNLWGGRGDEGRDRERRERAKIWGREKNEERMQPCEPI